MKKIKRRFYLKFKNLFLLTLMLSFSSLLVAQNITVSGSVQDLNGELLPGVTIIVKGTNKGTITDFNGNFTLSDVPESGTLVFSFVGMASKEIDVAGQNRIDSPSRNLHWLG